MSEKHIFEEKILYKTHQHWIIPVIHSSRLILIIIIPLLFLIKFIFYSWIITIGFGILAISSIAAYDWYLWSHSWLIVGNQKVTLAIRNGIWSQYAMSIRYRNIRDCAISKNSIWGYLFKYGSLFIRSSANEWDFRAYFVPRAGKIYAIVNALSRYTDDERASIDSIEKLHNHHQKSEFSIIWNTSSIEINKNILQLIKGITDVVEIDSRARSWIQNYEESHNHWIHEVLRRKNVLAFLHNGEFRVPAGVITSKNAHDEVFFPWVPFPELQGTNVISWSPWVKVHKELIKLFHQGNSSDATVLVGWDD